MYSIIFSSRKNNNPDNGLLNLLDSFDKNTTDLEKQNSEILIKFDLDDDVEEIIKKLDKYPFTIKHFTWEQNGGRSSLHEVQHYLYKFINSNSKWLQCIADDFIFTRPGFVTEILNIQNQYCFIGSEDYMNINGARGTCPCFSRKLIDACGGFFGPHANADGISTGLNETFKKEYKIDLGINIKPYYYRVVCDRSGEKTNSPFCVITKENCQLIFDLLAKNIYLNMVNDKII